MNTTFRSVLVTAAACTVAAGLNAQVFLREGFDYPDGEIGAVSGGAWVRSTGTPLNVSGGAAVINQGDLTGGRERASHAIGTPFTTAANPVAYYAFSATWSHLPISNDGSYFVNLAVGTTSDTFYGRVGADLQGAAAGKFRVSVANANWTVANSVEYPLDLSLGVTYRIVARYDLGTRNTTLWINPTSASSPSVTATDAPVGVQQAIGAINLRQGRSGGNTGAPGVIRIDDLVVGGDFNSVAFVPEPGTYAMVFGGGLLALAGWRRARR